MRFEIKTVVTRKKGILDPEGKQIKEILVQLGFDVREVRYGRTRDFVIDAEDKQQAIEVIKRGAERVHQIYTPQLEDFNIISTIRIKKQSD